MSLTERDLRDLADVADPRAAELQRRHERALAAGDEAELARIDAERQRLAQVERAALKQTAFRVRPASLLVGAVALAVGLLLLLLLLLF